MTDLADQPVRDRIATDIGADLFVEAGAGTGKTKSLVDRVETLVLSGVPITSIAAVTFTEKAGAELRDRLRERFEERHASVDDADVRAWLGDAMSDLDAAAFGTLHSFAQRILAAFPIQAGIPPLVEVLDEVSSSIGFDARWLEIRRRLLDDDGLDSPLQTVLAGGVRLEDLRALVRALGDDWDLIEARILSRPPERADLDEGIEDLIATAARLASEAVTCTDPADKFVGRLDGFRDWAATARLARTAADRVEVLARGTDLPVSYGKTASWPSPGLADLRIWCTTLKEKMGERRNRITDAAIRPIVRFLAAEVLAAADARRADGRLEFHDLLVLARDLLRRDESVRVALQEQYPRILLDEFQDTDPIQIEIAVRIAAGAAGGADDWHDIPVPDGSVFVVGDPKQSIYRFRRASIETYLDAQEHLGESVQLTTNFRSVGPVLDWVNHVFSQLIVPVDGAQPGYHALVHHRTESGHGPAVAVLGADEHAERLNADQLRRHEARDVAATISRALHDGWTIYDRRIGEWRPVEPRDIAVLVPARTSLPYLEDAFDEVGLAYRAEASSLVYQAQEIRDLLAGARAVADTADRLALVTVLRSPLFGCGDDDLWTFTRDGGVIDLRLDVPEPLAAHPVGLAIDELQRLRRETRWSTPSRLLERLSMDGRQWEVAARVAGPRARESWRRIRFVVDQARAWADAQGGGLRDYLAWAARQADDAARVAEAVLPESDVDAVAVMTVHAAKGLEFPMVVLSGMTSQPRRTMGVRLLWTPDAYEVRLRNNLETSDFETALPIDEQMDQYERSRLLYVAATRARDHLVVSLHRSGSTATNARVLSTSGAGDPEFAEHLAPSAETLAPPSATVAPPAPEREEWATAVQASRAAARRVSSVSASGLEGSEPEVALSAEAMQDAAGASKGARDLELPPWLLGRHGSRVGRAVHGVLQSIDLLTGDGLDVLVAQQSVAEGVSDQQDAVAGFVRSALATPLLRELAATEAWRESYVGTREGGVILEGIIDLLARDSVGGLAVVDYKTDAVPDAAIPARTQYYRPQLDAYRRMVESATGVRPVGHLLFLAADGAPARVVTIDDEPLPAGTLPGQSPGESR